MEYYATILQIKGSGSLSKVFLSSYFFNEKYNLQCENINKALEVNYTEEKGRFTVTQDNILPGHFWK